MKLSFVVTTHGAMQTLSSTVEYAVMYASAWIVVISPIVASLSALDHPPVTVAGEQAKKLLAPGRQGLPARKGGDGEGAGPRPPLAVAGGALPGRLVVPGGSALELHVGEDDHLRAGDDGDLAHRV